MVWNKKKVLVSSNPKFSTYVGVFNRNVFDMLNARWLLKYAYTVYIMGF